MGIDAQAVMPAPRGVRHSDYGSRWQWLNRRDALQPGRWHRFEETGADSVVALVTASRSENLTRTVIVRPALPFLRRRVPTRSASRAENAAPNFRVAAIASEGRLRAHGACRSMRCDRGGDRGSMRGREDARRLPRQVATAARRIRSEPAQRPFGSPSAPVFAR